MREGRDRPFRDRQGDSNVADAAQVSRRSADRSDAAIPVASTLDVRHDVIVVAWAGLGAAVAAGIAVRVTGALLAALIGYVVTLDQQTYSSHVYLLALTSGLLAVAHTKSGREPAVALLRWQLVIVYAFAAASKINPVFLSGLVIAANLRPVFQGIRSFPMMMSLAVATVAGEGFVAWSLLRPKWRTAGAAIGVVLHIGFVVMITETVAMIVFAMICLSMYPLFWLPSPPSAN
jgi:hypothetical protein